MAPIYTPGRGVGSVTRRCSANEPGGTKTGLDSAAEIEPRRGEAMWNQVAFLLANPVSDLVNPDCMDFHSCLLGFSSIFDPCNNPGPVNHFFTT